MTWIRDSAARVLEDVRALPTFEQAVLVLLLLAVASPYAGPTAADYLDPNRYSSIWNERPILQLNIFELLAILAGAIWLVRAFRSGPEWSSFDLHLLALVVLVVALQFVALERNPAILAFKKVDSERIALFLAAYLLVSRCRLNARSLKLFVFTIAATIALQFAALVLRHGLIGSTEFGTSTGRIALIITEDTLLIALPLLVFWGLLVDQVARGWQALGAVGFAAAVAIVELLSLRRGALIFVGSATLMRTVRATRRLVVALIALVAAVAVLTIAGAAGSLSHDVRYAFKSTFLATGGKSSAERRAELQDFARNTHGLGDVLVGHGLGAAWNAVVTIPSETAAFGSKETDYVRVGWHIYGLDWLYKLGALGTACILLLLAQAVLLAWRVGRRIEDRVLHSFVPSLGLAALVFLVFLFTNTRVAVFAGVASALVSKLVDLSRAEETV